MHLYFSGVRSLFEAEVLQKAGVDRYLADSLDWKNLPADARRALDSGAYRCFKKGTTVDVDEYCRFVVDAGAMDFAIMPDVIGDSEETHRRWGRVRTIANVIPVWCWGGNADYLREYLAESQLVCIGGLVPLMREKDQGVLDRLLTMCAENPSRFHLLGLNWLKAIELLRDTAYSADTSKFLDAARYGHAIFVNTRTGHLSQAPAKVLKLDWDRKRRCVEAAKAMREFCA